MDEIMEEESVVSISSRLADVSPISPQNEAIFEAGKKLWFESLSIERDFAKSMMSLSASAIPIYLGLLKFAMPENVNYELGFMLLLVSPAFLFLASLVLFAIAYSPKKVEYSLQVVDEIERALKDTSKRRGISSTIGFVIFILAIVVGIIVVSILLSQVYG